MIRFLIAACVALVGVSPAQAQYVSFYVHVQHLPEADVGNYDNIRTVAVISAIGQNLRVTTSNFWGSESHDIDIREWNLDAQLVNAVRGYAAERYDVVDVPHDPAVLAAIPNGEYVISTDRLRAYLQEIPAEGIDAFIVVRPSKQYDTPGIEAGLAMEDVDSFPALFANYDIEVVDARTYEIIGDAYSRLALREGEPVSFAAVYGSETLVFEDEVEPTEEQMDEMKARFTRLVSASLVETLRSLELGLSLPDVGGRTLVDLPADFDPYPGVERLAVVSTIGDVFESHHLNTAFNQGHASTSAVLWDVDSQIEAKIRETIGDRYAFVESRLDRNALYALSVVDAENNLRDTISELPPSNEFDAYLLVSKYPIALIDAMFDPMIGNGMGLWRTGAGLWVYAHFTVTLIDAQTLEPIYVVTASASPQYEEPRRHPIDDFLQADDPEDFTPEKVSALREEVVPLVMDMVDESMLRMLLTGRRVADGFAETLPEPMSLQSIP